MWIKRLYIAEDGTEFSDERACQEYEDNLRNKEYQCLEAYIQFYNRVGNPIPYSRVPHCLVYYAKVNYIPDWSNEKFLKVWEDIVPEDLTNRIECCGTGWYLSDGDDDWESWDNYSAEYSNHCGIINKIVCEGK